MSTLEFSRDAFNFGNTKVEVPKLTMLDSVKHLINNIDIEVRRKEWAIETNNRELVEGKDKTIEELHREIVELENVLELIPDVQEGKNYMQVMKSSRVITLDIARNWINKQIEYRKDIESKEASAFMERMSANPTPIPDTEQYLRDTHKDLCRQVEDLKEILQQHKKRNVSLELKLSNVETNQLETSIIFLPNRNGKLVPLKKQVELGKVSSGTLLNTVINIPAGYQIDKVLLSKVEKL
jgi:hypothetical protein